MQLRRKVPLQTPCCTHNMMGMLSKHDGVVLAGTVNHDRPVMEESAKRRFSPATDTMCSSMEPALTRRSTSTWRLGGWFADRVLMISGLLLG